jgi:hypothetical protein
MQCDSPYIPWLNAPPFLKSKYAGHNAPSHYHVVTMCAGRHLSYTLLPFLSFSVSLSSYSTLLYLFRILNLSINIETHEGVYHSTEPREEGPGDR